MAKTKTPKGFHMMPNGKMMSTKEMAKFMADKKLMGKKNPMTKSRLTQMKNLVKNYK
jgi:hypothetical protein